MMIQFVFKKILQICLILTSTLYSQSLSWPTTFQSKRFSGDFCIFDICALYIDLNMLSISISLKSACDFEVE